MECSAHTGVNVATSTYRRCRPALESHGIDLTTAPSAAILFQTLWTAKLLIARTRPMTIDATDEQRRSARIACHSAGG